MKPINVRQSTYINFEVENNNKKSDFDFVGCVRILKYENNFAKSYTQIFQRKFL